MQDHTEIWNTCLQKIETAVSKANFSTWFKNTILISNTDGTIIIGVQNEFVKDWLHNKYHKLIFSTLQEHINNIRAIEYVISKIEDKKEERKPAQAPKETKEGGLPLNDLYINKEDNLNPRYTFDGFIIGSFNELAYAASQAILSKLGSVYNPFFIYGGTGLGKTHLIQALGNAIKEKYPGKRAYYTTLEKFSIDYINAVQNNKPNNFKEKYRKYDVIIMDDIQFISNKEKTQEELFHLFNTLYESNKQIIFSSDKHPNFIPGLEDRLKSRFGAGMIVDIVEPEYESRLSIIKAQLEESSITLSPEILDYLASSLQGNIRELEGSLNSIICHVQLKGRDITLQDIKNLIKNNIKPKKNISIKDVVKTIADFYNIEEETIYDKTRRKEIVKARQIVMYVLREDFNISYPLIGQKLGGKDHTTVIHSCMKVKKDLLQDVLLAQELEQLRVMFN